MPDTELTVKLNIENVKELEGLIQSINSGLSEITEKMTRLMSLVKGRLDKAAVRKVVEPVVKEALRKTFSDEMDEEGDRKYTF